MCDYEGVDGCWCEEGKFMGGRAFTTAVVCVHVWVQLKKCECDCVCGWNCVDKKGSVWEGQP